MATSYHPDVIILDFTMPEFDGAKVVEQLRAHPRTKDIPILIQTGTVLNEEERQRLAGHVQAITYKTEGEACLPNWNGLDATSAEAVDNRSEPMTGNRILIIEDNLLNLELASGLVGGKRLCCLFGADG